MRKLKRAERTLHIANKRITDEARDACPGFFALATEPGPGTFARMLLTCQSGFETLLGRELADAGH